MDVGLLRKIGFTSSEAKVYLALLEMGPTTKGPLVKKAGIASSKIYEVIDRLIEKGVVSLFLKNNTKHFNAAPPQKINEYLDEKRKQIEKEQLIFDGLLPKLQSRWKDATLETCAEVFIGWKGVKTVYSDILETLDFGDIDYVFGASAGGGDRAVRFFNWFNKKRHEKGIKIKIIFNENAKGRIPTLCHPRFDEVRYLRHTTPSEINIYKNKTIILTLSDEPIAILIKSKEVAKSFGEYFKQLWKLAYGVSIFEGRQEIMDMLNVLIEDAKPKDEYLFFATDIEESNKEIQDFFLQYDKKRFEKNLVVKGLARKKIKKLFEKRKVLDMRYVAYPIPSNTIIFRDKIAILSWEKKPVGFLLRSKQISNIYRHLFYKIWKHQS